MEDARANKRMVFGISQPFKETFHQNRNSFRSRSKMYKSLLSKNTHSPAAITPCLTDKLKSVATDVATALASGVSSLFGSCKMKLLERKNEDLRDKIAIRDETIEQLQSNIKQMEVEH